MLKSGNLLVLLIKIVITILGLILIFSDVEFGGTLFYIFTSLVILYIVFDITLNIIKKKS